MTLCNLSHQNFEPRLERVTRDTKPRLTKKHEGHLLGQVNINRSINTASYQYNSAVQPKQFCQSIHYIFLLSDGVKFTTFRGNVHKLLKFIQTIINFHEQKIPTTILAPNGEIAELGKYNNISTLHTRLSEVRTD